MEEVWGFMEEGVFVELPKRPMQTAGMGPPPFDVKLPSGEMRHIIVKPPAKEIISHDR